MPNWSFNSLTIQGEDNLVKQAKAQLNKPFTMNHESYDKDTGKFVRKEQKYSNPVFAFWNIIQPTDLEAYYNNEEKKRDFTKSTDEIMSGIMEELATGMNWYDWNTRNWGTKWDVAVVDGEEYPETEITDESIGFISYSFNTAWAPPIEAIIKLSAQYPDLEFELSYEEETGWGGTYVFLDGDATEVESYENKCRDCESLNTMDYCDNDCGEICSDCNWLGEADLDCVAECDTHKVYLDNDHVPDYRKVK